MLGCERSNTNPTLSGCTGSEMKARNCEQEDDDIGIQVWGGKVLFRRAHGSRIAADPACCCGGGCECPTGAVEGFGIKILIPEDQVPLVTSEYGPTYDAGTKRYEHTVNVAKYSYPQTIYTLQASLWCENDGGETVWKILYFAIDGITYEGEYYPSFTGSKEIRTGCTADGLPATGIVELDTLTWLGDPAPEPFPFDIEIIDNPFP